MVFKKIFSAVRYLLFFKLTPYGWVFIFTVSMLILFFHHQKFIFFSASLLILLIFSFCINLFYPVKVTISELKLRKVMAGREINVDYQLENQSSFTLFNFNLNMFSLPPGMRILDSEHKNILAPSKATSLKIKMFFHRRGFYRAEKIRCCTFFPFNLFGCKKGKSLLADFLVYPRFGLIKGLNENNSSMKGYQQIPAAVRTGISDEYFSSRVSYQIDSPRHIDSRAWARLNTPAIKEYHNQQYLTTGLYLQTCPALDSKNKRNWELFEASVELAASCIYTVYDSGQRVEFISTSESFYNLKQYPNECFEKAMDFLARVQPAPEKLRAEMEFSKEFGKSMTNIIFIISEPASTPCSLIEYAMKTGCSTRLLIVSDSKQIKTPGLAVRVPVNIVDIKDIKNNSVILKDI